MFIQGLYGFEISQTVAFLVYVVHCTFDFFLGVPRNRNLYSYAYDSRERRGRGSADP